MASNVFIEGRHIEEFFQKDLDVTFPIDFTSASVIQQKSNFLSNIISYLYLGRRLDIRLRNISEIINVILSASEDLFQNQIFSQPKFKIDTENLNDQSIIGKYEDFDNKVHLKILNQLRYLIINGKDFCCDEKAKICELERYFMKLYLRSHKLDF